jgi:hypothetical protein
MSSQVVRVQSFSKGSLGGIGKEAERSEGDISENRNQDIDKNRTHLNEFFKHTQNGMFGEWKDTCKKLNVANAEDSKKNMTAFEGMVITSDKEYFENLGYVPGQEPPEKVKAFFEKSYAFAKQEIGFKGTDSNILSACVHYDETTPHLQLYYIPVVDSWKDKVYEKDEQGKVVKNENGSPIQARDDKGKIIYKDVENSDERRLNRTQFWQNKGGKTSYTQMQDRYYEQVSKEYGLGRGEKGSTKEHTTKAQWEVQKLDKELAIKEKDLTANAQKIEKLRGELAYAQDGSVAIPLLVSKQKTAEVQDQNKALRVEVLRLTHENKDLKGEVEKLKAREQARADALKDRNSMERKALDALDSQMIYKEQMAQIRAKTPSIDQIMQPYEKKVSRAHEYGQKMVEHKQDFVACMERRKTALEIVQEVQTIRSTLETNLSEIRAIERPLNDIRTRLGELERERGQYTPLQLLKKRDCDKQINDCKERIKGFEDALVTDFKLKGQTDSKSLSEEIRRLENTIQKGREHINEQSTLADKMTLESQEHLREYKRLAKAKEYLNPAEKRIVERYDKEYEPPIHKHVLAQDSKNGLPKGKTNERKETLQTMDEWKDIINKQKAEKMLEEPKPKIQTQSKGWDMGR